MSRIRVLLGSVAIAGALALLSGCTSHDGTHGAAGSPGAGSGAGPTGPSATEPAPGSTPTTAPAYPTSADAYARLAIAAWRSHDSRILGSLNAPSDKVFTTLDAGSYDNRFDTLYQCGGAAGSTYCTYYNAVGDSLRLQLRNDLLGHPHAIIGGVLTPITFPTDYKAYAQEALDDWLAQNTAAVALLTGKSGDSAFAPVPASARTQQWSFDHTEGATGHEYFAFHDSAGNQLGFVFSNPDFVSPPANRHGLIEQVVYTPHS